MSEASRYDVPSKLKERYEAVTELTDAFCREHLNEDYAELSRKMAAALSRKRPSPLEKGQAKSWAAGVVYTLGRVNFLSDKSFEPYMTTAELCEKMGVSQSNASAKSRTIWDRLDLMQMDPEWSLPEMLERNPLAWMIQVNGTVVDARWMPKEVQEEAYRLGLIPYVPGDTPEE